MQPNNRFEYVRYASPDLRMPGGLLRPLKRNVMQQIYSRVVIEG